LVGATPVRRAGGTFQTMSGIYPTVISLHQTSAGFGNLVLMCASYVIWDVMDIIERDSSRHHLQNTCAKLLQSRNGNAFLPVHASAD